MVKEIKFLQEFCHGKYTTKACLFPISISKFVSRSKASISKLVFVYDATIQYNPELPFYALVQAYPSHANSLNQIHNANFKRIMDLIGDGEVSGEWGKIISELVN